MSWCCCLALLLLLRDQVRYEICAFRQEDWDGLPGIEGEVDKIPYKLIPLWTVADGRQGNDCLAGQACLSELACAITQHGMSLVCARIRQAFAPVQGRISVFAERWHLLKVTAVRSTGWRKPQ